MSINVAIVGVGNCAKSLVEGVAHYTRHSSTLGLINPFVGSYRVRDITFVAAFDIDARKVGRSLRGAIEAEPNKTLRLADPLDYQVVVERGPTLDSVIPELREFFVHESDEPAVDVARSLRRSRAQIVVNYLPTGSDEATFAYAEAALAAGCSFINCIPTPIARNEAWRDRFEKAGLALLGDDIKSQCGATIVNRSLLDLCRIRGLHITGSEQVNYGGNADHFNLQYRAAGKEASKEAALLSVLGEHDANPTACMVYSEEKYDQKQASIKIAGTIFGGAPVSIDLTLEDEDSPNSGGVVVDAIRAARVLTEIDSVSGAAGVCSFLFKAPPEQCSEEEGLQRLRRLTGTPGPETITEDGNRG